MQKKKKCAGLEWRNKSATLSRKGLQAPHHGCLVFSHGFKFNTLKRILTDRKDIWMGRDLESMFKKEGTRHENLTKIREKSKKIYHFLKGWDLFPLVPKGRTQATESQGNLFQFHMKEKSFTLREVLRQDGFLWEFWGIPDPRCICTQPDRVL